MEKIHEKSAEQVDFISCRSEDFQFIFNNLRMELKDHNYSQIAKGYVSRTLVDKSFQHTINSLHFLLSGSAVLSFNGQKRTLLAGDVFLIGNHVKCEWEYLEASEEITLLFNIYLGNLDDLFASVKEPLIIQGDTEVLQKALYLFVSEDAVDAIQMRNICFDYVTHFLKSNTGLSEHIRKVKKYEIIFQYITENLSIGITLPDLARATNYSVGFFTKGFVKDNGITVKGYVHDKIMTEVEQLLVYSDVSVSEISDKFGFCELSYFTRWFKRYKGIPPLSYRKKLRSMAAK